MSQGTPLLTIILAAGLGTRMKSAMPKVLHAIGGRSMLGHVMALAESVGASRHGVVVGPEIKAMVDSGNISLGLQDNANLHVQQDRLGTGHAVMAAQDSYEGFEGDILILYGDTPLIRADSLQKMRDSLASGADISVLGFRALDPHGYGRLIVKDGQLEAIREQKDASPEELAVDFCNSGVFAFKSSVMKEILPLIGNDNASGEYYLTDAAEIGRAKGYSVLAVECAEDEVLGVNSRNQLAQAEAIYQRHMREEAMKNGATLQAPETVYFSYDTKLGQDVIVEPGVYFAPGVTVGNDCHIKAYSHLEETSIGDNAQIGPFARLRPGTNLADDVKVGNFVETKKANVEKGAKVNHLTYVGDARVGAGANIGAGTITCNYDGYNKHLTDIGENVFIGSNSALVAPVTIGDGAFIGAGSVISGEVEKDALAVTRAKQQQIPGWAASYHEKQKKLKNGA